jgi:hypothetical protein
LLRRDKNICLEKSPKQGATRKKLYRLSQQY